MTQLRLILLGGRKRELRLAAELAMDSGAQVRLADHPAEALDFARRHGADLMLADVSSDVPGLIAALRRERIALAVLACGVDAPATLAVAAVRAGALDYLPLPPTRELIAAALLSIGRPRRELVGADPAWKAAVNEAERLAASRLPLLIAGPPGSGRQSLAHHLHALVAPARPLVVADGPALAADGVDAASELFGHTRGAFDGALADRTGKLAEAAGGTLLLRCAEQLAPALQAELAAALPRSTARMIATTSAIAALHPDLAQAFAVTRTTLPPLAARGDDVLLLARAFAADLAASEQLPPPRFSADAIAALTRHDWPGNAGELERRVQRALLLAGDGPIEAAHLDLAAECPTPQRLAVEPLVGRSMEEVERALILGTLARCGGNRTSASAILGISVRTMRNKLRALRDAGVAVAPAT